jgi:hypothetical protein
MAILTIISDLAAVAIEHTRLVEAAKLAEVAQMMGDITHDIKNLLMPVVWRRILQTEINDLWITCPILKSTGEGQSRSVQRRIQMKDDAHRFKIAL